MFSTPLSWTESRCVPAKGKSSSSSSTRSNSADTCLASVSLPNRRKRAFLHGSLAGRSKLGAGAAGGQELTWATLGKVKAWRVTSVRGDGFPLLSKYSDHDNDKQDDSGVGR